MKIVQQILEEMLRKLAAADISSGLGQLIDENMLVCLDNALRIK